MPEVIFPEDKWEIFKILTTKTVFKRSFPDFYQGIDIIKNWESLTPESQIDSNFKLFHPNFDVSCVHISLFNINIDGLLNISSISLVESTLQSRFLTFAKTFELLNSVIFFNKFKYLLECFHINSFQFLIDSHCFNNWFVSFPNYFKFTLDIHLSFHFLGVNALEDNFWRRILTFNVRKSFYDFKITFLKLFLQDSLKFIITVVLKDALKGLGILSLGDSSVWLEDIFDRCMQVGFKCQINKLILNNTINTASF